LHFCGRHLIRNPFDRFAMDFVFAQAPRGLDDFRLIREQINRKSSDL